MNKLEIGAKVREYLTAPIFSLIILLIIGQMLNVLYYANGIQPTGKFQILYSIGFFIAIVSWFKEDCKKNNIIWVIDMGFFLFVAWILIIPIYLFKTRGVRAFITILLFLGIYTSTYLFSLIIYQFMI
jgi:hypothetical protein